MSRRIRSGSAEGKPLLWRGSEASTRSRSREVMSCVITGGEERRRRMQRRSSSCNEKHKLKPLVDLCLALTVVPLQPGVRRLPPGIPSQRHPHTPCLFFIYTHMKKGKHPCYPVCNAVETFFHLMDSLFFHTKRLSLVIGSFSNLSVPP